MLEHGGKLLAAAARYGIEQDKWLDLSTGINPAGWPVSAIPDAVWQRLPETEDGLLEAAAAYYGCSDVLPVAMGCAGPNVTAGTLLPVLQAELGVPVGVPVNAALKCPGVVPLLTAPVG